MTKLITVMAVGCLLTLAGCASAPAYKEKVTAYRPDLSDRSLGRQAGDVLPDSRDNPEGEDLERGPKAVSARQLTMLKRGDRITIHIYAAGPASSIDDVVDDNGNINLPFIGFTKIGGLTTFGAEKYIEKTYIDGGYYKQIQISIVKQFEGEYFVLGQINNKQGGFPLSGDTTLLEAIAKAGGLTVFADRKKIQLKRGEKVTIHNFKKMQSGDQKAPLLKPNDIIFVEKGWY